MQLKPKRPTVRGPVDWFTGDVWIDAVVDPDDHSTLNLAAVHFTPGARTAWYTLEGDRSLYVTQARAASSQGRARGHDPSLRRRAHAAGRVALARRRPPDHLMTHLPLAQGRATWGDHVTDDEYGAR